MDKEKINHIESIAEECHTGSIPINNWIDAFETGWLKSEEERQQKKKYLVVSNYEGTEMNHIHNSTVEAISKEDALEKFKIANKTFERAILNIIELSTTHG